MDWSTACYNKKKFSDTNEENPAKKNLHAVQSEESNRRMITFESITSR